MINITIKESAIIVADPDATPAFQNKEKINES